MAIVGVPAGPGRLLFHKLPPPRNYAGTAATLGSGAVYKLVQNLLAHARGMHFARLAALLARRMEDGRVRGE